MANVSNYYSILVLEGSMSEYVDNYRWFPKFLIPKAIPVDVNFPTYTKFLNDIASADYYINQKRSTKSMS